MEPSKAINSGRVILSGTAKKEYTWEHIAPQHLIVYLYAGELSLTFGKNILAYAAGDAVLVPKNQLVRVVKSPVNGLHFKAVTMLLPEDKLREFYQNRPIDGTKEANISKQRPIMPNALLVSFFDSLLSYFDIKNELPDALVDIKIQEVLTIIDAVDKTTSAILGTFSEIGKVDLEKYMEAHYMYNLPLERFAFLTGRSLTTFKSDFKKVFKSTPGKWLTQKRLGLAHYKIAIEKQRSTDVYLAAGFENLSHFSYAFKKAYGYSPSSLSGK